VTFAEQLDKYEVWHDTVEGKLKSCPNDDSLFDEEGFVVDADFKAFLEKLDSFKCWVDDHPEDRRAGLVSYASDGKEAAWYDAVGDCCWKETLVLH